MEDKNISNKALIILLGRRVSTPKLDSFEEILTMPLSEFKKGNYLIRVRCRHLNNEEVFIASTEREATIGRAEGLVVYLPDELINLIKAKATPEEVRAVHIVKSSLGGTLLHKE